MTLLTLCLARHGETDWNAEGRIQGQLDLPLNPHGRAQALALAAVLATRQFDAVYSSDLLRALESALPLAARAGTGLRTRSEWRERHHGRMQGRTYGELETEWPEGYRRFRARDLQFDLDGGESLLQFQARCAGALDALAEPHAGGTVMLLTHGGVIDMIYRLVTGQSLAAPRTVPIRNCAFHVLSLRNGVWAIEQWGVDSHLISPRDELPD